MKRLKDKIQPLFSKLYQPFYLLGHFEVLFVKKTISLLYLLGHLEILALKQILLLIYKACLFFKLFLKKRQLALKVLKKKAKETKRGATKIKLKTLTKKLKKTLQGKQKLPQYKLAADPKTILAVLSISFTFFFGALWFSKLPKPDKLLSREMAVTTKIYDRNGNLLYNLYQDKNRSLIRLEEIPEHLKWATIAIEDKEFYHHRGLSFRGIARSLYNIIVRRKIQGGSTLTQQLVKTALLTPERTVSRKAREIVTALRVELKYSKDEILQMYLNEVPYGGTAWGVASATEMYFGKKVKDLTLAESAFLAGLPAAPTYYSPFGTHPEEKLYKERQAEVLRRMVEDKCITQEEAEAAKNEELKFIPQKTNILAPHFVDFVRRELIQQFGEDKVLTGGLQVTTSLDLDLQQTTQEIVASEIDKIKKYQVGNGAALVTKPDTGEILSMVGSRDYFDLEHDGNVNVTIALRQPGSSIKPINYATFFKKGFTPATVLLDVPTTYIVPGQKPYRPVNYDGQFHGAVQTRFALGNSYNIPATRVLAVNSVRDMMKTALDMGITTLTDESRYGLSLTLGGCEVKMTEMATAFGTLANLGRRQNLVSILKVTDYKGKVLHEEKFKKGPQVLLPEIAYLISHILLDNNARTAAFGSSSLLVVPGQTVSVKTGTTDELRDNWTIGYTPSYLTAVWVGNNDNSPMNRYLVSGVTGAAPIWNKIMREILKEKKAEWPQKPDGIVGREICASSEAPVEGDCPKRFEYFIKGTEPGGDKAIGANLTAQKTKMFIDKTTNQPVKEDSTEIEEREVTLASDPLISNYCTTCEPYSAGIDISKIPYRPNIFEVKERTEI